MTLPPNARDRTGERYGTYTVMGLAAGRTTQGRLRWHLVCDCGRDRTVSSQYVGERVPRCKCQLPERKSPPYSHHTYVWKTQDEIQFIRKLGTQSPEMYANRPPRALLLRRYIATLDDRQFPETVDASAVRAVAEQELAREVVRP